MYAFLYHLSVQFINQIYFILFFFFFQNNLLLPMFFKCPMSIIIPTLTTMVNGPTISEECYMMKIYESKTVTLVRLWNQTHWVSCQYNLKRLTAFGPWDWTHQYSVKGWLHCALSYIYANYVVIQVSFGIFFACGM